MSTAFDSIKRGLLEAIEHAEGHSPQTRIHGLPESSDWCKQVWFRNCYENLIVLAPPVLATQPQNRKSPLRFK